MPRGNSATERAVGPTPGEDTGFAGLLEKTFDWLRPIPVVTPEQYRSITCNRCGLCCEDIFVPEPPERLAERVADPDEDDDRRRWLSGLEPVEQIRNGWRYRCQHFFRDAEGLGVCGVHETRPDICRDYPYGLPVRSWTECAWYVEVRDAAGNVVERVEPAE